VSDLYVQFPQGGSGSAVTGSMTGVAYSVGTFDGFAPKNANGGVIGSFSLYLQGATATLPGLVSSASQTFGGVKTFSSAPIVSTLSTNAPVKTDGSSALVSGSISLVTDVTGSLSASNLQSNVPSSVGVYNTANAAVNGAVIGSSTIYFQDATTTNPGMVSSTSQTFSGNKSFSNTVLLSAGAVATPSLSFNTATGSGLYQISSSNWGLSVNGVVAIDMIKSTGGFTNLGIGGQASTNGDQFPAWISRSQNNTTLLRVDNSNASALAASGLQANNNGAVSYFAGYASNNASELFSAKTVVWNNGGKGVSLICSALTGDVGLYVGGSKFFTVNSGGATVIGSVAFGIAALGSAPLRTTSGQVINGSVSLVTETTGSISLVNQVAGNLPISQTQGSLTISQLGFSVLNNPMTTPGDIIIGSGTGVAVRLGVGPAGSVLTSDTTASNSVSWQPPINYYNALVNSAFDYWQSAGSGVTLSATSSPTVGYTSADQWWLNNATLNTVTLQFVRVAPQVSGSLFGLNCTINALGATTSTNNTPYFIGQYLSNFASQTFYGKRASCSIQVRAQNYETAVNIAAVTCSGESVQAATVIASTTVSITSASFTNCVLNNFLIGTAHGIGGVVGFRVNIQTVSSGSIVAAVGGLNLEQGVLNLGPVVIPFQRQYLNPNDELAACQYFYEKSYDPNQALGTITNAGIVNYVAGAISGAFPIIYKVGKRTPGGTFTSYSPTTGASGKVRDFTTSSDLTASFANSNTNLVTNTTVASAGHNLGHHYVIDARM
jgi:hypothetical protein